MTFDLMDTLSKARKYWYARILPDKGGESNMSILCRIGVHQKSGEYYEFYGKLLELCPRCGCFHEVKGKGP